jgi:hypothetical protein
MESLLILNLPLSPPSTYSGLIVVVVVVVVGGAKIIGQALPLTGMTIRSRRSGSSGAKVVVVVVVVVVEAVSFGKSKYGLVGISSSGSCFLPANFGR